MEATITSEVTKRPEKKARGYNSIRTSKTEQQLFTLLAQTKKVSLASIVVSAALQAEKEQQTHNRNGRNPVKVDGATLKPDTNVSLHIDAEVSDLIDTLAESQGISKTELIHNWLWDELKEEGLAVLTSPVKRGIRKGSRVIVPATRKPGRPRKVASANRI